MNKIWNIKNNHIPKDWSIKKLPEIARIEMGQSPSSSTYNDDKIGLPFFQGKTEFGEIYPTINKFCSKPIKIAEKGAILLSVRAPVGPTNLASTQSCIGRGLAALHPLHGMSSKFLLLLLRSIEPELSTKGTGSTFKAITKSFIDSMEFAIPKLSIQAEIVTKVEELFSELDSGIASLKIAQQQLSIYRQSLLKHAFEGKLTEQWRKDNADKLETPEQLLTRIQQEREARYQQQLEEWQQSVENWEVQGKEGRKPTKPRKFREIELNEYTFFKNWLSANLGGISNVTGGLTKNQKRNSYDIKIPYLRVANVYANELRLEDIKNIGVTKQEINSIFLEKNDLLVVEGNGSLEQIGRVALWNGSISNCGHQNHLIRARLHNSSYAKLILYFLLSPVGRDFIISEASSTSGLHTLSLTKVSNILVPVIPIEEADELVRLLEEKLSIIEQNEKEIENALVKAELLRQSILKKAFSGKLNFVR